MKDDLKKKLIKCFKKVKLKKNSTIIIFSGLNYLMNFSKKIEPKEILQIIKLYCGKNSTIVVPAFFMILQEKKRF